MGGVYPLPGARSKNGSLCAIAQFQCILNPLESALTKNRGEGPSWQRARHESPISVYPSRWAQSRRISASQGGRFGFFGCVRSEGIRSTRCRNTAAECL